MDLLTPTVNVPAERAKLRRLRNEINEQAQARLVHERNYTARGYRRAQLPELPTLAAQSQPSHGHAQDCPLRPWATMDVLPAASPVSEAQTGDARTCSAACGLECDGLTA